MYWSALTQTCIRNECWKRVGCSSKSDLLAIVRGLLGTISDGVICVTTPGSFHVLTKSVNKLMKTKYCERELRLSVLLDYSILCSNKDFLLTRRAST